MDLCSISPTALPGTSFECECGKTHTVKTKKLLIEAGACAKVGEVIRELSLGENILVICDKNTYEAAGKRVVDSLSRLNVSTCVIAEEKGELHADERAIGTALIASAGMDCLVAVGAGTLNDITRYVAFRLGLPYIIVGTAPSMDGFASTVAPLIINGFKETVVAVHPEAIIGDLDVLSQAPMEMIAAGFGDMMKWTGLADWKLSHIVNGEQYCEHIAALMTRATEKCMDCAEALPSREVGAIASLMEGLVLSGLAMQMYGDSRPASGCEHHLSHYWEMRDMEKGRPARLHGDKVGVGAMIIMDAYIHLFNDMTVLSEKAQNNSLLINMDKMKEDVGRITILRPKCEALLKHIHAAVTPQDIGRDRDATREAIIHAKDVRTRYTLLCLLGELGLLEEMADWLCEKYGYSA